MRAAVAGLIVLLLSCPDAFAQAGGAITATGGFESQEISFNVQSAIAFVGPSVRDNMQQMLIVVISNAWIDPDSISDFLDRRRAVERLLKDDETALVYLEFSRTGAYRGLNYSFGVGNGCGFCASEATSTVKFANDRLVGTLKGKDELRLFDVNIDVPVMTDDHGAPLAEGGGPPGEAYNAYHRALLKSDADGLRPTLTVRRLESWNRANIAGVMDQYLGYLQSEHPSQAVHVVNGWASPYKATLLIEGISDGRPVEGEVVLLNENGVWHVDQEFFE